MDLRRNFMVLSGREPGSQQERKRTSPLKQRFFEHRVTRPERASRRSVANMSALLNNHARDRAALESISKLPYAQVPEAARSLRTRSPGGAAALSKLLDKDVSVAKIEEAIEEIDAGMLDAAMRTAAQGVVYRVGDDAQTLPGAAPFKVCRLGDYVLATRPQPDADDLLLIRKGTKWVTAGCVPPAKAAVTMRDCEGGVLVTIRDSFGNVPDEMSGSVRVAGLDAKELHPMFWP